ncbi:MAG TPA: hypothetical protein PLP99_03470 [Ignavibacteriales bacterium]|nr:hypothetical protein [Ignavibacteriales bacterium]HOL80804.1 hypothetical protein [Ignavibacteriales bacterium]HOM66161.1 hypothetical protein [Ignavibacteriales bacterium]HPP33240.1 hypothetical protein [Ignavibacteriales bacterium]HRR17916.1 hypothetical protein [Ignavibacteriales bacterium]
MTENKPNQPKTAFGRFMVHYFIPNFANNVQGLVYFGAAFLVIIIGLRGLGTVAGKISIVPKFLLAYDAELEGMAISPNWVMVALFIEFFLLLLMAITVFFTPEEPHLHADHNQHKSTSEKTITVDEEFEQIAEKVREKIRMVAQEELQLMDAYLEKVHKQHAETLQKLTQK